MYLDYAFAPPNSVRVPGRACLKNTAPEPRVIGTRVAGEKAKGN